jgi:hypothetical protein
MGWSGRAFEVAGEVVARVYCWHGCNGGEVGKEVLAAENVMLWRIVF